MSEIIGPRNLVSQQQGFMSQASGDGSDIKNKADKEIDRILKEQYERGMKLLTENRDVLDLVAKTLI